jgi:aldose sugar dehydrogenase
MEITSPVAMMAPSFKRDGYFQNSFVPRDVPLLFWCCLLLLLSCLSIFYLSSIIQAYSISDDNLPSQRNNTESNNRMINSQNAYLTDFNYAEREILAKYTRTGGETGPLRLPTSNTTLTPDFEAYYQNFTRGAIYLIPGHWPVELHGNFYDKWRKLGLERSLLGYPTTDQRATPGKDARYIQFQNGSIYSNPDIGTNEIHGPIYNRWREIGLERSPFGYPVSDVLSIRHNDSSSQIAHFQGGSISWTADEGSGVLSYDTSSNMNTSSSGLTANLTRGPIILRENLGLEVIFRGIDFPTSFDFLGPNDLLILEKDSGKVQRVINGTMLKEPLLDLNVASLSERGMTGIGLIRGEKGKIYVLLYFTQSYGKDTGNISDEDLVLGNRLYRFELTENLSKLTNPKLLLSIPEKHTAQHNGGKIAVSPTNEVYLTVGDLGGGNTTGQNGIHPTDGTGVIYRITVNGTGFTSNPFDGEGLEQKIFAYGIRNSFGLDIDNLTGYLWNTENGEGQYDEINLVEPGFNSGWNQIQGLALNEEKFDPDNLTSSIKTNSSRGESTTSKSHYSDPKFVWNQTVAVTGLQFYNSDKLGRGYKNGMFVSDFNNGNLYFFELNQNRTDLLLTGKLQDRLADNAEELEQVLIGTDLGGITDLKLGPDGYIYFSAIDSSYPETNTRGTIYKLVPVHHENSRG